jgi:TolB-like protein/DNA-binding winged helix-turn-helix (wHTH) protein/tetratricopeptide (TPR) repeat protein
LTGRTFRFEDWTLNLQSGELDRGRVRTRLQEHPLQVLALLLENAGQVVSREQLIAKLWPDTVVDFDTGLNTAVRKLRAALGDTADTPTYIETIPRRGYRFIGTVHTDEALAVSGSAPTTPTALPGGPGARGPATTAPTVAPGPATSAEVCSAGGAAAPTTSVVGTPTAGGAAAPPLAAGAVAPRDGWFLWSSLAAVAVVIGLVAWMVHSVTLRQLVPANTTFTPPPHSVAVLPFVNMSGDAAQEYFSDGLSEELLNALSRIDELQVAAQTSSFHFKGKSADLGTIAHELNVSTVLEGSVRKSGATVRITAQLVDATTGFHIWSETYDRKVDDALKVQSDIATAVASALKVTLLSNGAVKTDLGGTRNPQALDAYLRGLKFAAATLRSGAEARQTIAAFTEAIERDPNFALAYTARARTLVDYGAFFMIDATHETFSKAKADATRAVTLEPDLGEGHAALAAALEIGFLDFAGAGAEYERAMALSPGSERVLRAYSRFAGNMGHIDVGLTTARRCVELDPLNVDAHRALGEAFENARRFPEALAAFETAIKLNPTHATEAYQRAGRIRYLMGDIQKAKAACEAEPDLYHLQSCMPLIYEKLGQHEAAQAALAIAMESQREYSSYQWAQIYAQWGQPDKAIDWLEKGVKVLDPGVESMKVDPFLDPLRSNPRFQVLERTLRFPP